MVRLRRLTGAQLMIWERHHGKLWLRYHHGQYDYEIPFDETTRFVDGFVLYSNKRTLVKGMINSTAHLQDMEEKAPYVTGPNRIIRDALTALEQYQWHQLLTNGLSPTYATGPVEPLIVETETTAPILISQEHGCDTSSPSPSASPAAPPPTDQTGR